MALLPRAKSLHHGRSREDVHGDRMLLPELRHMGWDAWTQARPEALGAHVHARHWEICYLARGHVEWWVEDEVHRVEAGSFYLTRPGENHGGVDRVMHACELYWLQVRLPPQGRLPGMTAREGAAIGRAFAAIHTRVFPGSPAVREHFERLLAEHRDRDGDSVVAARAALHQLLVETLRSHGRHHIVREPSPPIRQAMELLTRRLDASIAMETVARAVGLGPSRFHERFVAELGTTPLEFLTRRRIERAQQLLTEDVPIAEVARQLGFTREHFSLVFRKVLGSTPAAWRDRDRDQDAHGAAPS